MKIRIGFVSNSSTCSFLMYGIIEDYYEIMSFLREKNIVPSDIESKDECGWIYDDPQFFKDKGLEIDDVFEGENITVGRSWCDIGDNETGKQFKESIEAEIKELFGDKYKCDTQKGQYAC